jgi:uncharacterized protein YcbX
VAEGVLVGRVAAVLRYPVKSMAAEPVEDVDVSWHGLSGGTFDTMPLSLITTRTVESLGALLGTDLNVLRFRPNLVIEAFGAAAFPEDEWVGQALTVGTTWMRIDGRDKRCVVVNVDLLTGRRDPEVLRAIATHRETCLGVYGSTIRPGRVAVGDSVILQP